MLAAATPKLAKSNPLNAALRIRTLVRHRSLIVMLTDVDDATVAGQLALGSASAIAETFAADRRNLQSRSGGDARRAGAHSWLDPYEALAAQEYLSRLERNVRALRALGAPALVTRPEHMERAVFDAYRRSSGIGDGFDALTSEQVTGQRGNHHQHRNRSRR